MCMESPCGHKVLFLPESLSPLLRGDLVLGIRSGVDSCLVCGDCGSSTHNTLLFANSEFGSSKELCSCIVHAQVFIQWTQKASPGLDWTLHSPIAPKTWARSSLQHPSASVSSFVHGLNWSYAYLLDCYEACVRTCCTRVSSVTHGVLFAPYQYSREIVMSSSAERMMNWGHGNVFIEQFRPQHHFRRWGLGKRWQPPTYTRSVRSDRRHIYI